MQYCDIVEKLEDIRAVYPNQTIWELRDIFKIVVSFQDLSKCGKELKGFTFYMEGRFHIVIDLRLRDKVQQAVAWHEFGHIINDADNLIAGETYFDSQIDDDYEMRSMERNANIFAAEGCIDDEEFMDLAHYGYTARAIASMLEVPYGYVIYKAKIMQEYGYKINLAEEPDSLCLQGDIYG